MVFGRLAGPREVTWYSGCGYLVRLSLNCAAIAVVSVERQGVGRASVAGSLFVGIVYLAVRAICACQWLCSGWLTGSSVGKSAPDFIRVPTSSVSFG